MISETQRVDKNSNDSYLSEEDVLLELQKRKRCASP